MSTKAVYDQPDQEKRTAQGTVDTITKQLWLACRGVAQPVIELQTETGIKDKTAQFWIELALKRSSEQITEKVTDSTTRDPRLNDRSRPTDQKEVIREQLRSKIQEETHDWLVTQPSKKWNELPGDSRECSVQINVINGFPNSRDTALRQQLRPGDHYNALLGFPGFHCHP